MYVPTALHQYSTGGEFANIHLQDLEAELDEQIAVLKTAMENACRDDNNARQQGQPALHKLKLLPEVMALLNRNNQQSAIVDPDANFLESVKFFLEPLSDGSLPAYNIQRDIFTALHRLPIEKETLMASGIGKIVLFYTKSKKAEKSVKRLAEQLLGEWSRPILRKTHDYKQRHVESRDFDYQYVYVPYVAHPLMLITLTELQRFVKQLHPPNSLLPSAQLVHRNRLVMRNANVSWHPTSRATAPG